MVDALKRWVERIETEALVSMIVERYAPDAVSDSSADLVDLLELIDNNVGQSLIATGAFEFSSDGNYTRARRAGVTVRVPSSAREALQRTLSGSAFDVGELTPPLTETSAKRFVGHLAIHGLLRPVKGRAA